MSARLGFWCGFRAHAVAVLKGASKVVRPDVLEQLVSLRVPVGVVEGIPQHGVYPVPECTPAEYGDEPVPDVPIRAQLSVNGPILIRLPGNQIQQDHYTIRIRIGKYEVCGETRHPPDGKHGRRSRWQAGDILIWIRRHVVIHGILCPLQVGGRARPLTDLLVHLLEPPRPIIQGGGLKHVVRLALGHEMYKMPAC